MDNSEILYNKLRDLYSKQETKQDSISKGIAIERIVNELISDIAKPLDQNLNVTFRKTEFDGEIALGMGKRVFYEIELGSLLWSKYNRILNDVLQARFSRRTYFLIIAYGFTQEDRSQIEKMVDETYTMKPTFCFMDYETLIALHKYNKKIDAEDSQKLVIRKRLFLERLLQNNMIISESYFDTALSFAEAQLADIQPTSTEALVQKVTLVEEPSIIDERINALEGIAQKLLYEIRALKEELRKKECANRQN